MKQLHIQGTMSELATQIHPTFTGSLRSLIVALILVIIAYLIIDKIDSKKHYIWNTIKNHLLLWFSIVWVMEFISYYIGITYSMGSSSNLLTATPMAILAAFGMFLSQSDISSRRVPCQSALDGAVFHQSFSCRMS